MARIFRSEKSCLIENKYKTAEFQYRDINEYAADSKRYRKHRLLVNIYIYVFDA